MSRYLIEKRVNELWIKEYDEYKFIAFSNRIIFLQNVLVYGMSELLIEKRVNALWLKKSMNPHL